MLSIIESIKEEIKTNLPGEEAHIAMSPTGRGKSSELIASAENYRTSSVAVILVEKNQRLSIVLTQRASYHGYHSNQISFPGGREEAYDKTPVATAIRETKEEIDFQLFTSNNLGKLTDVFIPVSKFLIRPFVFYSDQPLLVKNNREVAETFTIPIDDLMNPQSMSKMKVVISNGLRMTVPCFKFGKYEVWGATAIILNEFKQLIKPFSNSL